MKHVLFTMALIASLVLGSTLAFANSNAQQTSTSQKHMNAEKLKKGLNEAFVVEDGKDSWVLHQPKENPRQYFLPNSKGKMAGDQSDEGQAKHHKN